MSYFDDPEEIPRTDSEPQRGGKMTHHQPASRKGARRLAVLGAAAALVTALLPGQAASAAPGGAAQTVERR